MKHTYKNTQHEAVINDETVTLYTESTHGSGFVVREMLRASSAPGLKFQAGQYVMRPMMRPVYATRKAGSETIHYVTHHVEGDDIQKFHLCGFGSTLDLALSDASNNMLRQDIESQRKAFISAQKAKKAEAMNDLLGIEEIFRQQHHGTNQQFERTLAQEVGVEAYR